MTKADLLHIRIEALETIVFLYMKATSGEDAALQNLEQYRNLCRQRFESNGVEVSDQVHQQFLSGLSRMIHHVKTS